MQNLEVVHIKKKVNDSFRCENHDIWKKGWWGVGGWGGELRSIPLMKSIMENAVYMSH